MVSRIGVSIKLKKKTILYLVTEDWYFCLHRIPIATAAKRAGYRVVIATRDNGKIGELEKQGFEVIKLDWKRGHANPLLLILELARVRQVYRQVRPDLIHHIAIKPSLMGSFASLGIGVVIVNNLAGLGSAFSTFGVIGFVVKALLKIAFRLSFSRDNSVTIVENKDDRDYLVNDVGIHPYRVKMILGVGVNTDKFVPFPEPVGKVVVTMVSRMLWCKGVKTLIQAALILKEQGLKITIRLVGNTDKDSSQAIPQEQLKKWHDLRIVQWAGYKEDIPAVWKESHIAVLPSFYREGVPRSLLEAAACGRPIITTDMPGCREIVINGINGILIRPMDHVELAKSIAYLINNPENRKKMGAAGRKLVETQFSEDLVVGQVLKLYQLFPDGRF